MTSDRTFGSGRFYWATSVAALTLAAGMVACGGGSDSDAASSTTTTTTTTTDSTTTGSTTTDTTSGTTSGTTTTTTTTAAATTDCATATEQGARLLCLANAFRATLTSTELAQVTYTLTAANATQRWSNLPVTAVARNGLAMSALGTTAKAAGEALVAAALSTQGQTTASQLRAADGYLGTLNADYGSDRYYIAFLGTPSATAPWVMQFTGHHYTFHLSVTGSALSVTPMFVAVEPTSWTAGGSTYAPMAERRNALLAMLGSLDATQLAAARLTQTFDDVLVGPQEDGTFPTTAQGLAVSSLSAAQQALVKAAILTYAADAQGTGQAEAYTTAEALAATTIAWSSLTDLSSRGSYVRIDGPRVWIEFSVQGGIVIRLQNHYHSIWRDKQLDYGGNFTF